MGLFSQLGGLLQQYASGQTPSDSDVNDHFDQVTSAMSASSLGPGLSAAFRSDQTPPFAQMATQLFSNSSSDHQSGLLNTLLSSVSPEMLTQFLGNNPGSVLGGLLGNQTQLTPDEASQVPPEEVKALAEHAEKHDPSILDRVSEIYAEHPTLIKTLGTAAMAIVMKRLASQQASA